MQRPKSRDSEELARSPTADTPRDDNETDAKDAEQKRARTSPPQGAKEQRAASPDLKDRWGILPPKEAEDIVNAISGKVPERYRRWIEAYYQRVHQWSKR